MKRRLIFVHVFLLSLITFVGFSKPETVQAACSQISGNGAASFTFNFQPGGSITMMSPTPGGTLTGRFTSFALYGPFSSPFNSPLVSGNNVPTFTEIAAFSGTGTWTLTYCGVTLLGNGGLVTGTHFDDGRLNFADPWETAAIYCMGDGSVRVYVIGNPKWTIDFDTSPAEMGKVPKKPAHNTLIKQGHFAALSRLTNSSLQISAPGLNPKDGDYVFIFHDCPVLPAVQ